MKRIETNDLRPAMQLGGQNLLGCLNRDENLLPYFHLVVEKDYSAYYTFFWSAHNLGRWWDAMLRLESATGFEIPADVEKAMLENIQTYFDNVDNCCLAPGYVDKNLSWAVPHHSMRESLMALVMLIRYRNSQWARDKAQAMMKTLDRIILKDTPLTVKHPDYGYELGDATYLHGRLLEALVLYYLETENQTAYSLAERLAQWHYEHSTNPDGSITGLEISHAHSYLCTLRGLLQFGRCSKQPKYIERVHQSYLTTVKRMVKESGYASHDIGYEHQPETTCPGDAAQLALWLALEGYTELLDDAERWVRARILPSQVWETPPLKPAGVGEDRYADLEKRIIGGFGGMQIETHGGKRNTTDITAADIHTLTDLYRHIVVEEEGTLRVLFHFACEKQGFQMGVQRQHGSCRLTLSVSTEKPVLIRIPGWTPRESVTVTVNGRAEVPRIQDGFLQIQSRGEPVEAEILYALPQKDILEKTNGVEYTIRFVGDEIVGIAPNTDFYPLYSNL